MPGMSLTTIGMALGMFGRAGAAIEYLLRDEFLTDEAAPLTSPRTCEPGPGQWTVKDTTNGASVIDGVLWLVGATIQYNDPSIISVKQFSRKTGRALLLSDLSGNTTREFGFSASTLRPHNAGGAWVNVSGNRVRPFGLDTDGRSPTANDAWAVVLRDTGGFVLLNIDGNWTLLWVDSGSSGSDLYVFCGSFQGNMQLDNVRVADLPAPFDTDYGIATDRLAGARSVGDTFEHETDCLIEYAVTTLPSSDTIDFHFRIQDANNYWQVQIDSSGNLTLNEVVAGTPTQRGTSAGVIANGDRIVIVADGSTIQVYEASTLRITYASASNFASETAGEVDALGTDGAVSDVVSWPRVLSGAALSTLEAV